MHRLLAALTFFALTASLSLEASASTQTLDLDARLVGAATPPALTPQALDSGVSYTITVEGNWSPWAPDQLTPSPCPAQFLTQFESPSVPSGDFAGLDAEYFFSAPGPGESNHNPTRCSQLDASGSIPHGFLLFSLDGGTTFFNPAPVDPAFNPAYVYEYEVTGTGQQAAFRINDTNFDNHGVLKITVEPVTNSAPTAEAGPNQSIHAGQTVFLDGTGSTDLETDTADLAYAWSFLSRPAGSTAAFSDAASSMPSFLADQLGDYQIELTVNDEGGLSDSDQVTVTSENVPPQADAGADVVAIIGSLVTLDGGASSDADGDPLSYAWTLAASPAGSAAALVDADTRFPSLTPDLAGSYDIELVVDDGFESSLPDTVTVSAITPEEFALTVLMDVSNFIAGLPDSSFDKKQDRKKSTKEIAKTIDKIQKGQNEDAVHFIDKLIERADGCALRGGPDPHGGPFKHDFLTSCGDQAEVYEGLVSARDALDPCAGVVCEASDQCHLAGTCSDGFCSDPVAPDGTLCDDGDPATSDDACTAGVCAGTACVSDTAPSGECDPSGPIQVPCTTQNGDAGECAPGGICVCP